MTTINDLRSRFAGSLITPDHAEYESARRVWNGMIDKRPALIARCSGEADVKAALAFARAGRLPIAVRGGGHNVTGNATVDAGIVVDLSCMKGVRVDRERRVAVVEAGLTWGSLDAATQEFGLAVTGGLISTTGIAGLTLGGGMGWLTGLAGLSCDNLAGAEVVTADGQILRASSDEHPDLFWALRGGGGNFGVVTSFEYRMHRVGPLANLGLFFVGLDQGAAMLRTARELAPTLPRDAAMFIGGLNAPPEPFVPEEYRLQPGYALLVAGFGAAAAHADLIAPVRDTVNALFELVTPIPYANLQQMFDPSAPWGILGYEKAVYLGELTDAAIATIVEHQPRKTSPMSFTPIFRLGGSFAEIADDATAFGGRRSTRYVVNIAAVAHTQEELDADRQWARDYWSALVPHASGVGSYVNFMSEYEEDRVRAAYGPGKYDRLATIKSQYDPGNIFHLNANIPPARPA